MDYGGGLASTFIVHRRIDMRGETGVSGQLPAAFLGLEGIPTSRDANTRACQIFEFRARVNGLALVMNSSMTRVLANGCGDLLPLFLLMGVRR